MGPQAIIRIAQDCFSLWDLWGVVSILRDISGFVRYK
jgi:hypothetical protein